MPRILTYKKDISDTMKKKIVTFHHRKSKKIGQQKSKLCFKQRSHENKLGNFFSQKMKNVVDLGICLPCQFWHFYSTQLGQKMKMPKKLGKHAHGSQGMTCMSMVAKEIFGREIFEMGYVV